MWKSSLKHNIAAGVMAPLFLLLIGLPLAAKGQTDEASRECDSLREKAARVEQKIRDANDEIQIAELRIKDLSTSRRANAVARLADAKNELQKVEGGYQTAEREYQRRLKFARENGGDSAINRLEKSGADANDALDEVYRRRAEVRRAQEEADEIDRSIKELEAQHDRALAERKKYEERLPDLRKELDECQERYRKYLRAVQDQQKQKPSKKKDEKRNSSAKNVVKWGLPVAVGVGAGFAIHNSRRR